jgi:hypothetical protein
MFVTNPKTEALLNSTDLAINQTFTWCLLSCEVKCRGDFHIKFHENQKVGLLRGHSLLRCIKDIFAFKNSSLSKN